MQTLFGKLDEIAIDRLREFEGAALQKHPQGYYVAYSGGKDSDVILNLVERAGVKYTAHYHVTTCDPPELVRHVCNHKQIRFEKPKRTMWKLITDKGIAPLRTARFCCENLKENGGCGRLVVTGIRWQESTKRAKRKMIETCFRRKDKQFLNVIIDWSTTDVWQYLKIRQIETCCLYREGWKRLGCVLCPMHRNVQQEMERWPRIAGLWESAIKRAWAKYPKSKFRSAQEYWEWWLARDLPIPRKDEPMMFFTD